MKPLVTRRRALTAAAIAFAAWFALREATPNASEGPRVSWPAGTARTYQVVLEAQVDGASPMPGTAAPSSALVTRGQLTLLGYGEAGGRVRVGLTLDRVDEATMTLFGAPAMQDQAAVRAALTSGQAVLVLRPSGDLEALEFTPGTHNLFRTFAQTVAGELQAPLRAGAAWVLIDATLRGRAEAHYQRDGAVLTRTRVAYPQLSGLGTGLAALEVDGRSRLVLSPEGQLVSLTSTELLIGADGQGQRTSSRLEVRLEPGSVAQVTTSRPLTADRLLVDQPPVPADARAQMLHQRIDGLTRETLLTELGSFGASAKLAGLSRFMGRATGLLLAHPELCAEVAAHVELPEVSMGERTLALEVLAATGSPEAQAAMRAVLLSPPVATDGERRQRYLRLSLLQRPTPETVAFAGAAWEAATGREKRTLALVVGSTAGALHRAGNAAVAEPWVSALVDALNGAATTEDRLALTAALGNAGLESHQADVEARLKDLEPEVRSAAIASLRKTPNARARTAVVSMLGDPSLRVASDAVVQLGEWGATSPEVSAVIAAARAGRVPLGSAHAVLTTLEKSAAMPETRALLEWYLAQDEADPSVKRRARTLLEAGGRP